MKSKRIFEMVFAGVVVAYITYHFIERGGDIPNTAPVNVVVNNSINTSDKEASQELREPVKLLPQEHSKSDEKEERTGGENEIQEKASGVVTMDKKPRILLNEAFRNTDAKEMAVLILNTSSKADFDVSRLVADKYSGGFRTTISLIPPTAIADPLTQQLLLGDTEAMAMLELSKYTDYICMGIVSSNTRKNSERHDMTNVELFLDYKIFEVPSGMLYESYSKAIIGTGWSEAQARSNALQKIVSIPKGDSQ